MKLSFLLNRFYYFLIFFCINAFSASYSFSVYDGHQGYELVGSVATLNNPKGDYKYIYKESTHELFLIDPLTENNLQCLETIGSHWIEGYDMTIRARKIGTLITTEEADEYGRLDSFLDLKPSFYFTIADFFNHWKLYHDSGQAFAGTSGALPSRFSIMTEIFSSGYKCRDKLNGNIVIIVIVDKSKTQDFLDSFATSVSTIYSNYADFVHTQCQKSDAFLTSFRNSIDEHRTSELNDPIIEYLFINDQEQGPNKLKELILETYVNETYQYEDFTAIVFIYNGC